MPKTTSFRPARLLAFLCVGPLFVLGLGVLSYLHFRFAKSGISGFLSDAFALKPVRTFGIQYGLKILLPLYLGAGMLAWITAFLPGSLLHRPWFRDWRGREALGFGFSALLWAHLVLWWQVPTTLWVLPGLRAVPFVLLFPLIALAALAYPLVWLRRLAAGRMAACAATLACWIVLWSSLALAPQWLPRLKPEARGGTQPCKVLILGIDGLRSDTFLASSEGYRGLRYANAYTVIPATRLLWHILWGGDPMTFTIGHVAPALEEFQQQHELTLLRDASRQGWKPRFYIDDGGTIGTAGRKMDLDDLLMPAKGWENFVNSNLAVNFPLYASWENSLKPFPTTNPWADMEDGLKEALRLGRGSGWVMYHTCLAHQPIFLTRGELGRAGRWWTLAPRDFQPHPDLSDVTLGDVQRAKTITNPFTAYKLRMASILNAWQPIWNGLAQDPAYKDAVRVLFSDHGERFHNVANGLQLQGVHGFNLDPWECRATMLVAGPGFSDAVEGAPRQATLSLLSLRAGIRRLLDGRGPFDAAFFETCYPKAPFRYHTLATSMFGTTSIPYRAEPEKDLAVNTYVSTEGTWFTQYHKSAKERAEDASVGFAEGQVSTYFKPLKGGGAMKSEFHGYDLTSEVKIDEPAFRKAKQDVEAILQTEPGSR